MSQEPDGVDAVETHVLWRTERLLIFPLPFYVIGLFGHGRGILGVALAFWFLGMLVWAPWIFIKAVMQGARDRALVGAWLGFTLLPWVVWLVAFDWASTRTGLIAVFPPTFVLGTVGMLGASFDWGSKFGAEKRSAFLIAGSLAYAIPAIILFGYLMMGIAEVAALLTVLIVLLGGVSAIAAMALFQEATKPKPAA